MTSQDRRAAAPGDPIPDRPPVELPPSLTAPGGRSVPSVGDLVEEVAALAALLAGVVELAADRAVFPGRLAVIADLAREHDSVRRALAAPAGGQR